MEKTGQDHHRDAVKLLREIERESNLGRQMVMLAIVHTRAAMAILSSVMHPEQATREQIDSWMAFGSALLVTGKVIGDAANRG